MKKTLFFITILFLASIFISSCNKAKKPEVTVTFDNGSRGWYGDSIKMSITIASEEGFTVNITNNHDAQSYEETYAAGSTTVKYAYVVPNDLVEGDKVKISIVATNIESLLAETVEQEITASASGDGETITHSGTTTENEIWSANNIHIIDGTYYISGYTVTIAPGSVIKMNAGSRIYVGNESNSKLLAQGTQESPITFTSALAVKTAGDWDNIYFDEGTLSSTILEYCNFEYGGGDSYYTFMIGLSKCDITFRNCNFKYSAGFGVKLFDNAGFEDFENNTFENCANHLISIEANSVHTIGNTSTFTSQNKGIYVSTNNNIFSLENATWYKQTVPYFIDGTLEVKSQSGSTLNLEAGSVFKMLAGARIIVGDGYQGAIIANGTQNEPIIFTSGLEVQGNGDWDNILFEEFAKNTTIFNYCTFEFGGGDSYNNYMVGLNKSKVSFNNCTFKNSLAIGIKLYETATFEQFNNNKIENCGTYPITIYPNAIHTIGVDNNIVSSDFGIYIQDGTYDLTTEHIWAKQTCPYLIDGTVYVESSEGSGAILTIAAGVVINFKNAGNITIASSSGKNATFKAIGTTSNPIVFQSGFATPQAGQWKCLLFKGGTNINSELNYCNFKYGGGDSYSKGLLVINSTQNLTVENCDFSNSLSYGIYKMSSGLPANSDWQTVNTFSNNALGSWN